MSDSLSDLLIVSYFLVCCLLARGCVEWKGEIDPLFRGQSEDSILEVLSDFSSDLF